MMNRKASKALIIIIGRLLLSMQLIKGLAPTNTITIKKGTITSVAFDEHKNTVQILVSKKNKHYLNTYNPATKLYTPANKSIKKTKHHLLEQSHCASLAKEVGPYTIQYLNNTASLWKTKTQKHFCNLSHNAPITLVTLNQGKTKIITVSNDGIIKIWQLKQPIIFTCGENRISVESSRKNIHILKKSNTIKNMFEYSDPTTLNSSILLPYINNKEEFNTFFNLLRYKKHTYALENELSNFSLHQLVQLVTQNIYYEITNKDAAAIICKYIAHKYNLITDQPYIAQLPSDLQNNVARRRIKYIIHYIDHHMKPVESFTLNFNDWWHCPIAYNTDRETYASGSGNNIMIEKKTGQHIYTLIGHRAPIYWVKFCDKGNTVISSSADGTIKKWNISDHPKQELLKNLTMKQADLLEKIYSLMQENKTYELISEEERVIFEGIVEKSRLYLCHNLSIKKPLVD